MIDIPVPRQTPQKSYPASPAHPNAPVFNEGLKAKEVAKFQECAER